MTGSIITFLDDNELLFPNTLYIIASANVVNPEVAINPTYKISLKYIVCGFPTPGGFAGYLSVGIKNNTKKHYTCQD